MYLIAADKALKQNPRYPSLAQLLALIPKYGNNRAVTHVEMIILGSHLLKIVDARTNRGLTKP